MPLATILNTSYRTILNLSFIFLVILIELTPAKAETYADFLIDTNTTWTEADSPYIVSNTLILENVTLTIEAGTTVLFEPAGILTVDGELIAIGSKEQKITFNSMNSDPAPGDWKSIKFSSKSKGATFDADGNYLEGSILEHCIIKNAGYKDNYVISLIQTTTNPYINYSEITNNTSNAIVAYKTSGVLHVTNNIISNNTSILPGAAINVSSNGDYATIVKIINNEISQNTKQYSTQDGGALNIYANTLIIHNNLISKNSSPNIGGAITFRAYTFEVTNNTIWKNIAYDFPAISTSYVGIGKYSHNLIYENIATYSGGTQPILIYSRNDTLSKSSFNNNNLFGNETYHYKLSRTNIDEDNSNNYWGTNVKSEIEDNIYHYFDNQKYGIITYTPFLELPDSTAPISSPKNVHITDSSNDSMIISWDNNLETDLAGYIVYIDYDNELPFDEVVDIGNINEYTINNLVTAPITTFEVSAYDQDYFTGMDDPQTRLKESIINGNESLSKKLASYNLSTASNSHGTIDIKNKTNIFHGESLLITFNPNENYHISNVIINGISQGIINSFLIENVDSDVEIEAIFDIDTFEITSEVLGAGQIEITPSETVSFGEDVSFAFNSSEDYHLVDVLIDDVSVGNNSTYTISKINSNHSIHAKFSLNQYTINMDTNEGGTIESVGETIVSHGDSFNFNVVTNEGYILTDVQVDGISIGLQSTYTLDDVSSDHTVSADFTNSVEISVKSGVGGNILPSDNIDVAIGNDISFNISADEGYSIVDVIVDGISAGAVENIELLEVSEPHSIEALFSINTYTVTLIVNDIPTFKESLEYDESYILDIINSEEKIIDDIIVDGVSLGKVSQVTFNNIETDHEVEVIYEVNSEESESTNLGANSYLELIFVLFIGGFIRLFASRCQPNISVKNTPLNS